MANPRRKASAQILDRVRSHAYAMLTPQTAAVHHLGVVPRILRKGEMLALVDRKIKVPEDSVLVFEDQMPGANFGHPCRYLFQSPKDGSILHTMEAMFPPEVSDIALRPEYFHEPLAQPEIRSNIYAKVDWSKIAYYPWLVDDNRFALLWTSQISNRRHVEDTEFAYRILRHKFGFPASKIYVLCYNGTIDSTDFHGTNMATWVGDGTAYQMQVNGAATKANLQSTLTTIGNRMNADSLLFVHTNNHGSPSGLCVDNSSVVTPTEWSTMLDGMKSFGTLVVTMEQCYSGAFLQPTLDHSKASRTSFASAVPADKVSAGDSHFDQWARTWFEAVNRATAYGASLAHNPDANADGRVSVKEAFTYSDTYEYANIYDDPQYGDKPVGCGSQIYLTKAPSLADILREILDKYLLLKGHVIKHPIPDPPPDWSAKLLDSLELADALAQRFAAIDGRGVGDLVEESLKDAAEIAKAGHALAPQRVRARAAKAGAASARRR
ncbi:MAG: C13 family peptidase [Burkholderiales bacterium]